MGKRLTTSEFIERAKAIHGNKYGYDEVEYKSMKEHVKIYCYACKDYFYQTPDNHLHSGGCRCCEVKSRKGRIVIKRRKILYGVGHYDVNFNRNINEQTKSAYNVWNNILRRCYSESGKNKEENPTYDDCFVCEEWKYFSNFYDWYSKNRREGYAIDKDILCKDNKCYCPQNCCFVPQRINNLIGRRQNCRGKYPIGVTRNKNGQYEAKLGKMEGSVKLGTFDRPELAFLAYKKAKEQYVKEVADEYYDNGLIDKRVRNGLYNWKININE